MAAIVTDDNLNIVAEGPVIAVYQPPEVLALMDDWNQKTHGGSGLRSASKTARSVRPTRKSRCWRFGAHVKPGLLTPVRELDRAGSPLPREVHESTGSFFHYRNLDVSTLKELACRWKPAILPGFTKSDTPGTG